MDILRDIARLLAQYVTNETGVGDAWFFPNLKPGYNVWVRVDVERHLSSIENRKRFTAAEVTKIDSEVTEVTIDAVNYA